MNSPSPRISPSVLSRIRRSRWRIVVQSFAIAGLILQPVPLARSYWTDSNHDGVKEWVADPDPVNDAAWFDQDSDGDGLTNGEEVVYGSDPYSLDSDLDGLTDKDEHDLTPLNDPWSWSSDGSGFSDHDRYYHELQGTPLLVNYNTLITAGQPFYSYVDADGDGIQNQDDPDPLNFDRDGDGILNWNDSYMDDPNNGSTPPDTTTDSDGDGIPDYSDPFPWGSFTYNGIEYPGSFTDSDGDGIPDPADPFPSGSFWYNGTEYAGAWTDSDNDGVPDVVDPFPNGSFWYNNVEYAGAWADSDMDGIPDSLDPFPNGSFTYNGVEYGGGWVDQDGDGIPDPADPFPAVAGSYWYAGVEYAGTWSDADGDGIPDAADLFPNGSYWYNSVEYAGSWVDSDSDGNPDPADPFPAGSYIYNGMEYGGTWTDSDGDGIPDPADAFPLDSWNGAPHYTYNGTDYPGEFVDYDGDGVPDPADSWPADPENGLDSDLDGLDNYTERTVTHTDPAMSDTDHDYLTDGEEALVYHTNPLDPRSVSVGQTVLDFFAVGATADTDGDGIPDAVERHYATTTQANPDTWLDPNGDLDGDGVTNLQAYNLGWDLLANLNQYDQDGDGITDVLEDTINAGTIYNGHDVFPAVRMDKTIFADAVKDLDGDGLLNIEEARIWAGASNTNAAFHILVARSILGTNRNPATWIADWDAAKWFAVGSGSASQVSLADNDHNGRPDGYDLWVAATGYVAVGIPVTHIGDVDQDGMTDVWEHRYKLDFRDPANANVDSDGDGLSNLAEFQNGTHPRLADSDGDGFKDGIEVQKGSDPKLRSSTPLTVVQAKRVTLKDLVQQYLAARADPNATLADRKALWDAIDALKKEILGDLDDILQDPDLPSTLQAEIQGVEGDTEGDDDAVESTPSSVIVEARWLESSYSRTKVERWTRTWTWSASQGIWEPSQPFYEPNEYTDGTGGWTNSDVTNNSGPNASLAEAKDRSTALNDWKEAGSNTDSYTATGSWEEGDPITEGNADDPPEEGGEENGQTEVHSTVKRTPESFSKQYREYRIKRSGDGNQSVPLSRTFVKQDSDSPDKREIICLQIGEDETESSGMLTLDANPETGGANAAMVGNNAAAPASGNTSKTKTQSAMLGWIQDMTFSGDKYHELESDDGKTTYKDTHWRDANFDGLADPADANEINYPVAFTKGGSSIPKLKGKFVIPGIDASASVKVKATIKQRGGTGTDIEMPATSVTRKTNNGQVTYELAETPCNSGFEDKVRCYNAVAQDSDTINPLKIEWQAQVGSDEFKLFGITRHTVYLTYGDPVKTNEGKNEIKSESLFNLGCRNAEGLSSSQSAIGDAIYHQFENQSVQRVKKSTGALDGKDMTYWSPGTKPDQTQTLLRNGDTTCGGWARFFMDCLRAQGIDSELNGVLPPAQDLAFVTYCANQQFPGKKIELMTQKYLWARAWSVSNWGFTQQDQPGIKAQGNKDPISKFDNHAIVICDSHIYDPSYGAAKCSTQIGWEWGSLAGYGVKVRLFDSKLDITNPPTYNGEIQKDWLRTVETSSPSGTLQADTY